MRCMARNGPPKSLKGDNDAYHRLYDFPWHVSLAHKIATAANVRGIETRSTDRDGGIDIRLDDSLRCFQRGDGSD